ncbi:PHP domain-containing protein [Candidatus Micrarchaeota archaeon]|jgi:hypothetical protein|nr:PHP domain-containing protein [Candidatus Micrarchaeota archaeon]
MNLDLHIHTEYSIDSQISLKSLVSECKKKKITPGICDHGNSRAHEVLHKMKVQFIPGIEIYTQQGHLIAYYTNDPVPNHLSFAEALDKIQEQGAIACAPHPFDTKTYPFIKKKFRKSIGTEDETTMKKCDLIEVFNSRADKKANQRASEFSKKHKISATAGSDAHFPFEIGAAFIQTAEDFDIEDPKQFIKTIKSKNSNIYGKQTTFFVHGTTSVFRKIRKWFGGKPLM